MVFALAPIATYAAAYIKFDGISAKKMPRMRVTDKTTVHEVAVFAARHAGVDVGCINLSWRGQELWGQRRTEGKRRLGSYSMLFTDEDQQSKLNTAFVSDHDKQHIILKTKYQTDTCH